MAGTAFSLYGHAWNIFSGSGCYSPVSNHQIKLPAVGLPYRDLFFCDDDPVLVDAGNLVRMDDVGTMYPHETIDWQLFLERLEAHK